MDMLGLNKSDSYFGKTALNSVSGTKALSQSASILKEEQAFNNILKNLQQASSEDKKNLSSSQVNNSGRPNGDYTMGFHNAFTSEADKHARPSGAAANQSNSKEKRTIDKTSRLYEQALELENYFVKNMLSSMRKTINKSDLLGSKDDYAQNMYEDMLYDNYAEALTKNASFGLADQIYLQLESHS